jgi:hypothetical protein
MLNAETVSAFSAQEIVEKISVNAECLMPDPAFSVPYWSCPRATPPPLDAEWMLK